jgi:hypothetical protein
VTRSTKFPLPSSLPPERTDWAYKMSGPFAAENFAHGSYCVICAMTLQCKDERTRATLITGFEMKSKDEKGKPFEADFSMFIEPSFSTQTSSSAYVIGECKSYNRSDNGDYARARQAMQLFPGRFMFRVPFAAQFLSKNDTLRPSQQRAASFCQTANRETLS